MYTIRSRMSAIEYTCAFHRPTTTKSSKSKGSFHRPAVGGFCSSPAEEAPYLVPCIKSDSLSIQIGQDDYVKGMAECQFSLRGRLILSKGDKPYTTRDLASKLGKVWKMVPFGRGYYDFLFEHLDDLSRIWTVGTVSLQPGLLRLSQWTKC